MNTLETLLSVIGGLVGFLFRPASRLWPVYLAAMVVLCFGLYLRAPNRDTSFARWAFPSRIYRHPSHVTDIKLWIFGQVLTAFGFFQFVAITSVVATHVSGLLGGSGVESSSFGIVPMTMVLILANDFAAYWVHRLHHETPVLWPFHSVHHSAEVMTPITVSRKHPLYDIISNLSKGLLGGLAQGLLLGLLVGQIEISTIMTVNAGYFLFNIAGSNLRHTHMWWSYGRLLEHIVISPAQHQIHHSIQKRHFNKNYGEIFAFWDWMFGTLYVPDSQEELAFGLCDGSGVPIEQPHTGLLAALWVPFQDSWRSLKKTPAGERTQPVVGEVTGSRR